MSKPELSGAERDAEIDRLTREFPEDGTFSRQIRDTADLPDRPRPAAPRRTANWGNVISGLSRPKRGRSR